jgi:hypothetical protein
LSLFLWCSAVLAGEIAADRAVTLTADTDKTSVSIGDKVRYRIKVRTDKDMKIKFPDFGENLAEFAIRDFGSSKGGFFGSKTLMQWYELDIYETGKFTIPPAVIKYRRSDKEQWNEAVSDSIEIEVLSLLDNNGEKGDIRDIKGPVSLLNLTYVYIILAMIAVTIVMSLIIILLKKRRKSEKTLTPSRPAHEIAYEALKELLNRNYLKAGKVQEYYFEMSNIVRHYIENRFHLKAPEMTTEEFLLTLNNSEVLNPAQKGIMREFLSHCDMVKFAKYLPDDKEIESSYDSAKKFVDQTKEVVNLGAVS